VRLRRERQSKSRHRRGSLAGRWAAVPNTLRLSEEGFPGWRGDGATVYLKKREAGGQRDVSRQKGKGYSQRKKVDLVLRG